MWRLDRQAANPWECERCSHGAHPHPIDEADPDAEVDDQGAYIPGYRLAPTCLGELEEVRFRQCPEHALRTWCAELLQLWRLGDGELTRVAALFGSAPSAALFDAWDLLAAEMQALRRALDKRHGSS